jgi:hypothetical protein
MSCDACERMLLSDQATPHDGLKASHNPVRLRPLGRPPVVLQRYCCKLCGYNWLEEADPLLPGSSDWVCLYAASTIFEPGSALRPALLEISTPAASNPKEAQEPTSGALGHCFG